MEERVMRSAASETPRDAISDFCASLLIPGLGQWLQGRRSASVYFFVEAVALLAVALLVPRLAAPSWVLGGAVVLWSAFDAARVAQRHPDRNA
jgi:hypothetical protein